MALIQRVKEGFKHIFSSEGEKKPEANFFRGQNGSFTRIFVEPFDGEKNLGEIGPAKYYLPDHAALAARSKQSFLENDISQVVLTRSVTWTIGKGLKIQPEPQTEILRDFGIEVDRNEFAEKVQPKWNLFANSKFSSHNQEETLNEMAYRAELNAHLCGDVLVVCRFVNNRLTVQLIDGQSVVHPQLGKGTYGKSNRIDNGVEINKKGQHVAYHVLKQDGIGTQRIEAYGRNTGLRMAWMLYGRKYRLTDNRGIPALSSSLETLAKLDRYQEATVGTAEEQAKVALQINHQPPSDGENVFASQFAKAKDADRDDLAETYEGEQLANRVAATTNRSAFNMPVGAEMKPIQHTNGEINFKEFYTPQVQTICSTVGIPPEVAFSLYNSNFSASRAALKDWEHTMDTRRHNHANGFYQPIYDLWLTFKVIQERIDAPGFIEGLVEDNKEVLESYRGARWVGKNVPHIDPMKEVKAMREKLGGKAKNLPLSTLSKITEELANGDSRVNLEKYAEELKEAERQGISLEDNGNPSSSGDGDQDPDGGGNGNQNE